MVQGRLIGVCYFNVSNPFSLYCRGGRGKMSPGQDQIIYNLTLLFSPLLVFQLKEYPSLFTKVTMRSRKGQLLSPYTISPLYTPIRQPYYYCVRDENIFSKANVIRSQYN
jgi:hypothetical protein